RAMRYHHADRAALFALQADAVWRGVRLASIQKSAEDLDQLIFVDGAAPQLEINKHVVRDGSRLLQGLDVVGPRIHDGDKFLHVLEVTQRLNTACGRAGADGHQELGSAPNA